MKKSKRPLIGIGPNFSKNKRGKDILGCYLTYIDAIEDAGGDAIILTPSLSQIPRYLKMIDGFLMTGGDDLHPKFFGQKKMPKIPLELSPEKRSRFEIAFAKKFLKTKKPMLGICLGCQTLNVANGGTLYQDLPSQLPRAKNHREVRHLVHLSPYSKLKQITGKKTFTTNTNHHQAIDRPGKNVLIVGRAPDGVVEAIEILGHPFALGLQWHPEELKKSNESSRLFKSFIQACL